MQSCHDRALGVVAGLGGMEEMSNVVVQAIRDGIVKREKAIRELREALFKIEASADCLEMWEYASSLGLRDGGRDEHKTLL